MSIFTKSMGPIFLREKSFTDEFIKEMLKLKAEASKATQKKIDNAIFLPNKGKKGEDRIAYYLKNCNMDMYILHDVYFETQTLTAQIDFLVITRKNVYVIESKNWSGNIEIDSFGNFKIMNPEGTKFSGCKSPVIQNEIHMQILKEIYKNNCKNSILKIISEIRFKNRFKPLVVFTGEEMYLEKTHANKYIKNQVIKADQLTAYINHSDRHSKHISMNENSMYKLANLFLENSNPEKSYFAIKDRKLLNRLRKIVYDEKQERKNNLVNRLTSYRSDTSRIKNTKPFLIFTDEHMKNLIRLKPKTIEELLEVPGFGKSKANDYGEDILKIINDEY